MTNRAPLTADELEFFDIAPDRWLVRARGAMIARIVRGRWPAFSIRIEHDDRDFECGSPEEAVTIILREANGEAHER